MRSIECGFKVLRILVWASALISSSVLPDDARGDVQCAELALGQCDNLDFETTTAPVFYNDEHLIIRPAVNKVPVIASDDIAKMLNHFGKASKNLAKVSFQNMILRPLDMGAISFDFSLEFEDVIFIEDTPVEPDRDDLPTTFQAGPRGFSIRLEQSKVAGDLLFRRVTFRGKVGLSKTFVGGDLIFEDINAGRPIVLNGLETNGRVSVGGVIGHQLVVMDSNIRGGLDLTDVFFVRSPVETILLPGSDDRRLKSLVGDLPADAALRSNSDHREIRDSEDHDRQRNYCDCVSNSSNSHSEENCDREDWLPLCPVSTSTGRYLIEIAETEIGGRIRLGALGLSDVAGVFPPPLAISALVSDVDSFLQRRPLKLRNTLSWIRFHGVTGRADLQIEDLGLDRLYIQQSDLGRVSIRRGGFRWLIVVNNAFSSFDLLDSDFFEWVYFKGNISRNGVNMQNFDWLPCEVECGDNYKSGMFEVSGNRVDGNLVVRPFSFGLKASLSPFDQAEPLPAEALKLQVVANDVSGQLEVVLPIEEWYLRSHKDLAQHTIAIDVGRNKVASKVKLGLSLEREGSAHDVAEEDLKRWPPPASACPVGVLVYIDKLAAGLLEWNFPLLSRSRRCFRWQGGNFEISQFNFPAVESHNKEAPEGQVIFEDVKTWRGLLAKESPPSLYPMAEYLSDQGDQQGSRRLRQEAKTLEYEGNGLMQLIFWPTGYGENPVRAIMILTVVYLLSVIYYSTMSEVWKGSWPNLFELREDLLRRDAMVQAAVARRGALIAEHSVRRSMNELPGVMSRAMGLEAEGVCARRDLLWAPVGISMGLMTLLAIGIGTRQNVATGTLMVVSVVAAAFLLVMLLGIRILRRRDDPPDTVITISFLGWLKRKFSEEEIFHLSIQPGFLQFDRGRQPENFSLFRYTLDVMVPLIDLHGYNRYYPADSFSRFWTMAQHLFGWWVLTSALAALAHI